MIVKEIRLFSYMSGIGKAMKSHSENNNSKIIFGKDGAIELFIYKRNIRKE